MLEVAANGVLYTAGLSASTRTTRRSLILLLHAYSLAHARGGSQTRTCFCLSLPLAVDGHTAVDSNMQEWIRYCRSSSSNIIVRLLKEAKSQVQPERDSCESWSTHIARLLHVTKLLCEPTIVVLASIAL